MYLAAFLYIYIYIHIFILSERVLGNLMFYALFQKFFLLDAEIFGMLTLKGTSLMATLEKCKIFT